GTYWLTGEVALSSHLVASSAISFLSVTIGSSIYQQTDFILQVGSGVPTLPPPSVPGVPSGPPAPTPTPPPPSLSPGPSPAPGPKPTPSPLDSGTGKPGNVVVYDATVRVTWSSLTVHGVSYDRVSITVTGAAPNNAVHRTGTFSVSPTGSSGSA